jgi:hypothetical protein
MIYKHELGLIDPVWTSYGEAWRSLATLWLRAENALLRAGRPELEFKEIKDLNIPEAIKDWMISKRLQQDARPPDSRFGNIWTDYLRALPLAMWQDDGNIFQETWCRTGKTGIVMFVLGLYWQAEHSGGGHDWEANLKFVEAIFELILSIPEL